MATLAGRNRCVTCGKEKATLRCGGCLKEFCFNHSTDHRQELSKQLDEVEVDRDLFQQTLITEETTDSQKHALIEQINDWERDSIKKIQQTAEEERQKLFKYVIEHIKQIKVDLNKLTDRLRQSREGNDFYETDLQQWNEELTRLTKELAKPSNINLCKNPTSLINTISVDMTSGFSDWRGNRSGGATNRNDSEDSNRRTALNSSATRGGRFRGDRGRGGRGFSSGKHENRGGGGGNCYNCNKPGHQSRDCPEEKKPRDIAQTIEEVRQVDKKDRLCQLFEQNLTSERCLIFVETKRSADYIGALLSQKQLMSTTMHGDRTQKQRSEAVQQFTNGKCTILVATSDAARGLDFPLIGYVVNYDLPDSSDFYIHRIGRTGRAGHLGKSISFFDPDRDSDRKIAPDLVLKLSEAGQEVPEFLKQYADGSNAGDYGGRNTDMRSGSNRFGSRTQAAGPSGGTASASAAEEGWD